MVRKVIWTRKAEILFEELLQFYIDRNGTKTFSCKILQEVKAILSLLKKQPFLGSRTSFLNLRVIVTRNYKIFDRVSSNSITVILISENHEDPDNLSKVLD